MHQSNPLPTPDQQAVQKKVQEGIEKMQEQVAKARNEWTDRIMQAILPDALYNMAKTNKGRDRMKVQKWMVINKVRLKEWPDRTEIVRNGEILGRFFVTIKNSKLEVEATVKKGLLRPGLEAQSPNSATENPSVVPPVTDPEAGSENSGDPS